MKKIVSIFSAGILLISLAGCAQDKSGEESLSPEVTTSEPIVTETPEPDQTEDDNNRVVDIDLTGMSSNMVYSYVYNMMYGDSDSYIGKTIKVAGQYYKAYYEETKQYYHFVIVADALACCSQGIEFVWDDNAHEYPAEGAEIEVVGTFGSYEELGQYYYYLNVFSLTVK